MIRDIDKSAIGKEVFVYRNLHNGMFSVRDVKTGRVLGHSPDVLLTGCKFKVSEAGRQRVIRTKRKNVHAGVQGYLSKFESLDKEKVGLFTLPRRPVLVKVWYNPYVTDCFRFKESNEPIHESPVARICNEHGVLAW